MAYEIGTARHVLHPARDDDVGRAGQHRLRREVHRLLRRAALAVHGGARHVVGKPGGEPRGAGDVAGLRPDGVDAAEDHVLDGGGIDARAGHQRGQHGRAEVGGMHPGQPAAAPGYGGADGFHDVGLHQIEATKRLLGKLDFCQRWARRRPSRPRCSMPPARFGDREALIDGERPVDVRRPGRRRAAQRRRR